MSVSDSWEISIVSRNFLAFKPTVHKLMVTFLYLAGSNHEILKIFEFLIIFKSSLSYRFRPFTKTSLATFRAYILLHIKWIKRKLEEKIVFLKTRDIILKYLPSNWIWILRRFKSRFQSWKYKNQWSKFPEFYNFGMFLRLN